MLVKLGQGLAHGSGQSTGGGGGGSAPVNTVAPVISGTMLVGQTQSCTTGTWTGTATITYTYQWRRDGANIGGATASTYTLVTADAGKAITCAVTGTNGIGNSTAASNSRTLSAYLDGVIASVCCDLDATIAASYGGSGETWANLIAAPADGAAQADYDAWRGLDSGAGTDNPTFTGSAGSASAYFALDGGDQFTMKSVTAPLTIYNMHKKTGGTNRWWVACAVRFGTDVAQVPWGRGDSGNTYGVYLYKTATAGSVYVDRATTFDQIGSMLPDTNTTTDYLIIISMDMEATANNVRTWTNTTTGSTQSKTWTSTSTNPTRNFHLGASAASGGSIVYRMTSGGRYYAFACGNEFLDDTKAAAIFAHYEARHARDYTP